jgi:hypothetical protein
MGTQMINEHCVKLYFKEISDAFNLSIYLADSGVQLLGDKCLFYGKPFVNQFICHMIGEREWVFQVGDELSSYFKHNFASESGHETFLNAATIQLCWDLYMV